MAKFADKEAREQLGGYSPPFVRSAYNYDVMAVSDETGLRCDDPSLTEQSHAQEADINFIVKRCIQTQQLPPQAGPEHYGDFGSGMDYHTALNMLRSSQEAFNNLPAEVRSRFDNDPGKLLDFVHNDENYEEAVKLGIVTRREDLSTPAPKSPPQTASEGAGVGKSGKQGKASRLADMLPKGFKIVPDDFGGGEGEE